ncbi:DUF2937 family protein [Aliiglaciecola litoralis]|uniref:DUF2937 family protein n=1 Tax=Aliiglaciecola litoralis TaxID=582857 RepID=A0ABP3X6N9_9ALTE
MMSWCLKCLGDYFRLSLFAAGILLGVQIPNFVIQYEQRIDARLLEAQQNLAGFQFTANRHFNGSITQLIDHYRASNDKVFVQDANSIQAIVGRVQMLAAEHQALQTHPILQVWHIAVASNRPILKETYNAFSFSVPLTLFSLLWGAAIGVLLTLVLDITKKGARVCYHRFKPS